jgi:hypothetical protein
MGTDFRRHLGLEQTGGVMRVDEMSKPRRRALQALVVETRWAGDFDINTIEPAEPLSSNRYYFNTDAFDEAGGFESGMEPWNMRANECGEI